MAAVISGNGLGLGVSTWAELGSGALGSSGIARLRDGVFINVANGNLVTQGQDESFLGQGLQTNLVRTYNSGASAALTGSDGWQLSLDRHIDGDGNPATQVRRMLGDGSEQVFSWSATRQAFVSGDGGDADDTLVLANGVWTWTEGTSRRFEQFALDAGQWRLSAMGDQRLNARFVVQRDGLGQIISLLNGADEGLVFAYEGSGRLAQVWTREAGQNRSQAVYRYDDLGRLEYVAHQKDPTQNAGVFSPGNSAWAWTRYSYDGVTPGDLKLSKVEQSDGLALRFGYDASGRVSSMSIGDGASSRLYRYEYHAGRTEVTDPSNQRWTYFYDAAGRLTAVHEPARNGLRDETRYAWTNRGQVESIQTLRAGVVVSSARYAYDGDGNRTREVDGTGQSIWRTFEAGTHRLLSETRFVGLDANALDATPPAGAFVTRYVYDANGRVRFQLTPSTGSAATSLKGGVATAVADGVAEVTEFVYDDAGAGRGQLLSRRRYTDRIFTFAFAANSPHPTIDQLSAWAATSMAASELSVFRYDPAGRLQETVDFAELDGAGNGIPGRGERTTRYSSDAHGRLLFEARVAADRTETKHFSYDGLGRLILTVDGTEGDPGSSTITSTSWDDINATVTTVTDAGLSIVETYNKAGELTSRRASALDGTAGLRETRLAYDTSGRLRMSEDETGGRRYFFYDAEGALSAEVDDVGSVTTYERDALGRVVTTVRHAAKADTSAWWDGSGVAFSALQVGGGATSGTYLQVSSADDRTERTNYDLAGRVSGRRVEGSTSDETLVETFLYDGASRLIEHRRNDRVERMFYDEQGRQVGMLDAEGAYTRFDYDAGGRLVLEIRYAVKVAESDRSLAIVPIPSASGSLQTRHYYNAAGQRVGTRSPNGQFTEFQYDSAGRLSAERLYRSTVPNTESVTDALVAARSTARKPGFVAAIDVASEVRHSYDARGLKISETRAILVETTVGGSSFVSPVAVTQTSFQYDGSGRLVGSVQGVGLEEVRSNALWYDALGQLRGELTVGANEAVRAQARSLAIDPAGNRDALEALYATNGTRHRYDLSGRRVLSIDAEGNHTHYFYDTADRLIFLVRGNVDGNGIRNAVGEVMENRYNAFGDVDRSIQYFGHIALALDSPETARAGVIDQLVALRSLSQLDPSGAPRRSETQMQYSRRGWLSQTVSAESRVDSLRWNAFGQKIEETMDLGGTAQRTDRLFYDHRGALTDVIEAAGSGSAQRTTSRRLDAFGREVEKTDALGTVSTTEYDTIGRVIAVTTMVDSRAETRRMTYDAFDRVTSETDAAGFRTLYTHLTETRAVQVTTAEGIRFTRRANAHGEVLEVTDATGRTVTMYDNDGAIEQVVRFDLGGSPVRGESRTYDALGRLETSDDGTGRITRYRYDALARVIEIDGPDRTVSRHAYDAAGRNIRSTNAAGEIVERLFDAEGRLKAEIVDPQGLALRTEFTWDALGRQLTMVRGAGTGDSITTRFEYDVRGRRIAETVDPAGLGIRTQYIYDANDRVVERISPDDRPDRPVRQRFVYDDAGRLAMEVDGAGGLTRHTYDLAGRRVQTIRSAARLSEAAAASLVGKSLAEAMPVVAGISSDKVQSFVYDRDGRLVYTIDPTGALEETLYDASGQAVETRAYLMTVADREAVAAKLLVGNAFSDTIFSSGTGALALRPAQTADGDQRTRVVRDAAGRERFVLTRARDQSGTRMVWLVTERRFDAAGRVLEEIVHGAPVTATTPPTSVAAMEAVVQAFSQVEARITRFQYDSAGRLQHRTLRVDSVDVVETYRYDAVGRRIAVIQPTGVEITSIYDKAGRLQKAIDPDGTETFEYDAAGNQTARIDRLGHRFEAEYDAAGRKSAEYSPEILTAQFDAAGDLMFDQKRQRVATRFAYDGRGNLIRRTENADVPGQARTTVYEYDARGLQIAIRFPGSGTWNANRTLLTGAGVADAGPRIDTTYDALGRAVANRNASGAMSYRVYDASGRLVGEVDEEGQVSIHRYDAFGQKSETRRLAGRFSFAEAPSLAAFEAAVTSQPGRSISYRYDSAGRLLEITQPEVEYRGADGVDRVGRGQTRNFYNARGDLVRESTLLDRPVSGAETWANTAHYHDQMGRRVLSVDAEGQVTAWNYDALGRMTQQVEFARRIPVPVSESVRPALPAPGDADTGADRILQRRYDAMGRVVQETQRRSFYNLNGALSTDASDVLTAYDAEGRVVATSVNGLGSTRRLDAIGRTVAILETQRRVVKEDVLTRLDGSDGQGLDRADLYEMVSPLSEFAYDAFGNVVVTYRWTRGTVDGTRRLDGARTWGDQASIHWYDGRGRMVKEVDSRGRVIFHGYDNMDRRVSSEQALRDGLGDSSTFITTYRYDATGRQTGLNVSAGGRIDLDETVAYNAFGEVTSKSFAGVSGAIVTEYDAAGRIRVTTGEGGARREYRYNLAGHLVAMEQATLVGADAGTMTQTYRTDRLGRVLELRATASAGTALTQRVLDRWGNALRIIDARGNATDYRYDDRNQINLEIKPRVRVLNDDGSESWTRPETHYGYDVDGRLVTSTDANGFTTRRVYDIAGNVIEDIDALGQVIRFAYDSAGNERLSDRPNGANGRLITYQDIDGMGRIAARGEYVVGSAGGLQRRELEAYELNQNGDRIAVTSALGEVTRYIYDSQGRVLVRRSALGIFSGYGYDSQGRKISEQDGNANVRTWRFDAQGRLVGRTELKGAAVSLDVDAASGLLRSESRGSNFGYEIGVGADAGAEGDPGLGVILDGETGVSFQPKSSVQSTASRQFLYFPNGLVREINEPNGHYTRYTYDLLGNRTSEETYTTDASPIAGVGVRVVHQLTELRYDALNRLARATTYDLAPRAVETGRKVVLDIRYDYDAVGNRRRVINQSGEGFGVIQPQIENDAPVTTAPIPSRRVPRATTGTFRIRVDEHFIDPEGLGWANDAFTFELLTVARNGSTVTRTLNPDTGWLRARYERVTSELVFTYNTASTSLPGEMVVRLSAKDNAPTEAQRKSVRSEFTLKLGPNAAPEPITAVQETIAFDVRDRDSSTAWSGLIDAEAFFVDLDENDAIVRLDYRVKGEAPAWMSISRDMDRPSVLRVTGEPRASRTVLELMAVDRAGNVSVVKEVAIQITDGRPVIFARPPIEVAIEDWQFSGASMIYADVPVQFLFGGDFDESTLRIADGNADQMWGYTNSNSELGGSNDGSLSLSLSGYVDRDADGRGRITVEVSGTNEYGTSVATTDIIFVGRSNVLPQPVFADGFPDEIPVSRTTPVDMLVPISALFTDFDAVPEEQRRLLLRSGLVSSGYGYGYGDGYGYGGGYEDGYPESPFPVDPLLPPGSSSGWLTATFADDGQHIRLRGTPPATSVGRTTYFSLAFFDGGFARAERGFTIRQRAEQPPVRNTERALADYVVMPGAAFAVTLPPGLFNDVDGDPIALTAQLYVPPSGPGEVEWENGVPIVIPPLGRWEALPAWMSLDPQTGVLTGTAPADQVGQVLRLRLAGAAGGTVITSAEADEVDPAFDFEVTVRPATVGTPFQSTLERPIRLNGLNTYFSVNFGAAQVTDPEGAPLRFDSARLLRLEGGNYVPYSPQADGGSFGFNLFGWGSANGSAFGTLRRDGTYRVEARGTDAQGNAFTVVRTIVFANAAPEASAFNATVVAGAPFDLPLNTFRDPDASWWNRAVFSAQNLPPGITLTTDGRIQGQIEQIGDVVTVNVTITDSLSGVSATAPVTLRAEAEAGGLAPRVNTAWAFLPNAAQTGNVAGPYRLVERVFIPGRPATDFAPAIPGRWESAPAPGWISVDATTGRLEGTPPTVGRVVLAYEVEFTEQDGTTRVMVLQSFTLNVRDVLVNSGNGPAVGPPLVPVTAVEGRYFRWVMPSSSLEGATVRLARVDQWNGSGWSNDGQLPQWLRWSETFRSLDGTPPEQGRFRLVFAAGEGNTLTEIPFELEARAAQTGGTGTVTWPEPGLGDGRFVTRSLDLHGGLNLAAWTAMGNGPGITFRAGVARTTPTPVPPPAGKANLETLWFSYDGLNRVVINQGTLNNGSIELAPPEQWSNWSSRQSHRNVYDSAGRVVAQESLATRARFVAPNTQAVRETVLETRFMVYDVRGNVVAEGAAASLRNVPTVQLAELQAQYQAWDNDERTAYFLALRDLVPEATTLRRYDDLGRLAEERELYPPGSEENVTPTPPPGGGDLEIQSVGEPGETLDVSGWLKQASTYEYDADGRMRVQSALRRNETILQERWTSPGGGPDLYDTGVKTWVAEAWRAIQADPTQWRVRQQYAQSTTTLTEATVTSFVGSAPTAPRYNWRGQVVSAGTPALGYDGAGNLLGYTVQERSGATVRWTDTYSYEYAVRDGYLETRVSGTSTGRNRRASETLSSYDGWGRRTSLEERTNLRDFGQTLRSARYFAYDAEGGLISRRSGELVEERNQPLQFRQSRKEETNRPLFNPVPGLITGAEWTAMTSGEREYWSGAVNTRRYAFANGQLLGSVSEAGQMAVGDRLTGFENSSLGTSTVVVRSGETLRSVAQRVYGDGSLWYVLADANGLTNSDETLAEGQNLQVPQVGTATNSASTFKPYDPSEQIGPTAPSLPTIAPPPKNSCNPIAQLLMVIVAVVVTIYTAGAVSSALGATAGTTAAGTAATATTFVTASGTLTAAGGAVVGAAAGAAGALASSALGSVLGVSSFSWRNIAAGAVSGGLTGGILPGISGLNSASGLGTALARSAVGNAAAGAISGEGFSWRAVVANVAGSAVGAQVSRGLGKLPFFGGGSLAGDIASEFVSGSVAMHARRALGSNESVNYLNPLGNAVGSVVAMRMRNAAEQTAATEGPAGVGGTGSAPFTTWATDGGPGAAGGAGSSPAVTAAGAATNALARGQTRLRTQDGRLVDPFNNDRRAILADGTALTPTLHVSADSRTNQFFMDQWDYAIRYGMAAPRQADWDHIDRVRLANDALTRPAHSAYVSRMWEGRTTSTTARGRPTSSDFAQIRAQAFINGVEGAVGNLFNGVDGALAAVQSGVQWFDAASDQAMAMNPSMRFVKDVAVSMVDGAVGGVRVVTNRDMGLATIGAVENPMDTLAAMKQAFHEASWYEIAVGGTAAFAGLGAGSLLGRGSAVSRFGSMRRPFGVRDWTGLEAPNSAGSTGRPIGSAFQSEKYAVSVAPDGRRVYKNLTDIDPGAPAFVDRSVNRSIRQRVEEGWTNLDLMNSGYAPIGPDGKQMNLHHVLGQESGPMVELQASTHQRYSSQLHGLIEDGRSFRNDPVLNRQYNEFRREWWKSRAADFQGDN